MIIMLKYLAEVQKNGKKYDISMGYWFHRLKRRKDIQIRYSDNEKYIIIGCRSIKLKNLRKLSKEDQENLIKIEKKIEELHLTERELIKKAKFEKVNISEIEELIK